jgi:hypothetical protein
MAGLRQHGDAKANESACSRAQRGHSHDEPAFVFGSFYTKIGARGRADAIAYALRHRLDTPPV